MLKQAAQRGSGCLVPGSSRPGWMGPGQPGLVPDLNVGGLVYGRGVGD